MTRPMVDVVLVGEEQQNARMVAMAGRKSHKSGGFSSLKKQHTNGKSSGKKSKLNPFDVKQNAKTKFQVLGKRIKGQTRNVAVARAQAETKRRKTLAVQYKTRNKSNAFKDKRIGEQDPSMSLEDKMMARFQTERKRKMRNAQMYVLGDGDEDDDERDEDEEEELFLTHDGKQIDDYDQLNKDAAFDDEDDDEFAKKMDKEVVEKLHFGAGANGGNGDDPKKSHKEIMHEVMMKSKMYKAERQKNKVAQEDATDNLDAAFSEIQGLLSFRPNKHQPLADHQQDENKQKPEMDEFDKMTREFAFEAKAKATERRMSPEELAKREKDRLDALEKKRIARMNGDEDEDEEEDEDARKKKKQKQQMIIMPPRLPTDDDLEEAYEVDARFRGGEEEEEEKEEDEDEEEEDEEEEEEEESDDEEDDEEEEEEEEEVDVAKKKSIKKKANEEEELPYVFDCPESLVELLELFEQYAHNAQDRGVIMERLVTYYSPKLSVANQKKMSQLLRLSFDLFLRYAAKYATYQHDFDWLTRHLQRLSQELPDVAGVAAREFLIRVFKRMRSANGKAQHHGWPEFRALLLCKALVSVFPVTDLRHNVVSPLETLLGECMTNGQLTTVEDTRRALMCAMLSLVITKDKKRFTPEVLNVLKRVLVLFVARAKSESDEESWLLKDFKKWQKQVKKSVAAEQLPLLQFTTQQGEEDNHGTAAAGVLQSTFLVLRNASRQYAAAGLASFFELVNPLYLVAHGISQQLFSNQHTQLNSILDELHQLLEESVQQRQPLRLQTFAPATIKTLTPKFDENYSLRKDKTMEKEKAQMKQLERQVKRARKNAARELRRDAEFLARAKEQEEDDRIQQKQQKQKEIRRWLEEQNATFNEQVKKGGHMLKGGGSGVAKTKRVRLSARGKK